MKTVTVSNDNKDDAYTATVLLFNQIKQMSLANVGGWGLGEVYTNVKELHFITEYTNGKVWIKAVSIEGHHAYSFGAERQLVEGAE
jgi:hypothetical protein